MLTRLARSVLRVQASGTTKEQVEQLVRRELLVVPRVLGVRSPVAAATGRATRRVKRLGAIRVILLPLLGVTQYREGLADRLERVRRTCCTDVQCILSN